MNQPETPVPPTPRPRGLVALNLALLAVLGAVTLAPDSNAQRTPGRARGDYTMVSGRIVGGNSNAVYVVDASNQEVLTLLWNQSAKGFDVIAYRDLTADGRQPTR